MIKRCIFHIPFYIEKDRHSGSHIRPMKMIRAFKEIGYEVDEIMGYGKERSRQINEIKKKIDRGVKYDFLYSESSTMPTLLTERNHLPTFPFLDFEFFSYCKNKEIPISLFYRDVYWKFPAYREEVSLLKQKFSKFFYEHDLRQYSKLLDVLYLPSIEMYPFLEVEYDCEIKSLPPGIDLIEMDEHPSIAEESKSKTSINIFYVGGIDKEIYNLEGVLKAVNKVDNVYLTLCTREKEWDQNKEKYKKYIQSRVQVIHKSGKELIPYYKDADILNLYIKPTKYRDFAMPVKLFEYLSHKKPILGVKNTAVGTFIEENDVGWSLDYGEKEVIDFLNYIKNNKEEWIKKKGNIEGIIKEHTWIARASQVAHDLLSLKNDRKV